MFILQYCIYRNNYNTNSNKNANKIIASPMKISFSLLNCWDIHSITKRNCSLTKEIPCNTCKVFFAMSYETFEGKIYQIVHTFFKVIGWLYIILKPTFTCLTIYENLFSFHFSQGRLLLSFCYSKRKIKFSYQ